MDQRKIGALLRDLRKEKGVTQEELAEKMMVSNRTVSRWETGSNLPDIEILIELSDYYNVDLREILDGERKGENNMDKDLKETVIKVADYKDEEKKKFLKFINILLIVAFILGTINMVINFVDPQNTSAVFDFFHGFCGGVSYAALLAGVLATSTKFLDSIGKKK
ncbi:MAG: helix-turn-helix domain-containing protein [Oscillospiraceae bacterium]|nr:helix-turn-helix domain-containing protein [Candidatus Limimonas egerieequi]